MPEGRAAAPVLTDGRVLLNGLLLEDAAAHLFGEDEEQARRFGWYPDRSTMDGVRAFITRGQEEWRTGGSRLVWATRDASTGELAGGCEIHVIDDGVAHMSYWTFPTHRRHGFVSSAITLAAEYAFRNLGVERLEVYVEPDNVGSRRAAERAGFVQEGILRNHSRFGESRRTMVVYSKLPTDK